VFPRSENGIQKTAFKTARLLSHRHASKDDSE
jgi:hypothetical protein